MLGNILQPMEANDQAKLKKNLFQLNTRLLTTTFLVDNKPTLADFFVLPALKTSVVRVAQPSVVLCFM